MPEGSTKAVFEWSDAPPPRRRPSEFRSQLQSNLDELTKSPGKWAVVARGKSVTSLATNLRKKFNGKFEFATRGHDLYAVALNGSTADAAQSDES